ncbi:hypothetical protein Tco_0405252 [Tanacetum coccineum]
MVTSEATTSSGLDVLKAHSFLLKAFQVTADASRRSICSNYWPTVMTAFSRLRTKYKDGQCECTSSVHQVSRQLCNGKKDPFIFLEGYKVNWHYASDDPMFTTIKQEEATTDIITQQEASHSPKEKKSRKAKQKTQSWRYSEYEGTGFSTLWVSHAPDYDSEDDISWKSSDDDQDDDEQVQDDEDAGKNDVNETKQDDEDDDDHDDDEKVQDNDEHEVDETAQEDDDEEQTESDDDGDDFVHPKLTTHDDEIIHEEDTEEDDSSAKLDEEATYEEDQGNEAVEDTNTDLDGRDEVMTDVILPQVQATQEIEDTHVTLTPVNPDGQQQSSSHSLIDYPVTAIMGASFTTQINRPPTPYPLVIQTQQPPILTPTTTTSSLLQNLPNFASLFGFDYRLKALEDNFSELRQTNQYAEALSSIPGTVDQYLANKMQEAVDVAVQLKYDKIREESTSVNQQFLDSIDEGMKKIIKEQVKKEVSKIITKVEKFITNQLESEVLVRSSKEANTSHAVAANLSELELKKILIDNVGANNLSTGRNSEKLSNDDQEPSAGTDRGSKRRRSGKEPASTSAPIETREEEVQHLPDWFQQPTRLPSPDHAWNKSVPAVHESVQPWMVYKTTTGKIDWINLKVAYIRNDLRKPLPLSSNSQGTKTTTADYGHIKWIEDLVQTNCGVKDLQNDRFASGELTWGQSEDNSMHLNFKGIARNVYLKKGSFCPKEKVTNLSVEERIAFNRLITNVYTKSCPFIYSSRGRVEDLQLVLKAIRRNSTSQSLGHIDAQMYELHKFSDGTLDDVRTALNDRLKGIRMAYLPQTFWSQRDKANARAMIQAIDKRLKTRRIMRSLERFVGGRPYGGDLRLLQRTI